MRDRILKHIFFQSYIAKGGKECLKLGVGLCYAVIVLAGVLMCNSVRLVCAENPKTQSDQPRIRLKNIGRTFRCCYCQGLSYHFGQCKSKNPTESLLPRR